MLKYIIFKLKCWKKKRLEKKEIIYSDFYDNEILKGDLIK